MTGLQIKHSTSTPPKTKYGLYQLGEVAFLTLNSQDSLSSIVGKQQEFFNKVLDTISSQKIVILSHKLIFMNQHPVMDDLINKVCNGKKGNCYYCHNPNNFQEEIYAKLVELAEKGRQLIWVGGDLGQKTSKFEYIDDHGIVFLGNGIWFERPDNYILLFQNRKQNLEYKFISVDTLLNKQKNNSIARLFE